VAAEEIHRIATMRRQQIETATQHLGEALASALASERRGAALSLMREYACLQRLVALPDAWRQPLDAAYERLAAALLSTVQRDLAAALTALARPAGVLDALDGRWRCGMLTAERGHELRSMCQHAERVVEAAARRETEAPGAGAGARSIRPLRAAVEGQVASIRRLLNRVADGKRYVDDVRRRCQSMALPQPEQWVSGEGRETELSLGTIVGFVEERDRALKSAQQQHARERDGLTARLNQALSSAGAAAASERQSLLQQIGGLEQTNRRQAEEIERLTQLLVAAQVPHQRTTPSGSMPLD
jgi:hypothetical protein